VNYGCPLKPLGSSPAGRARKTGNLGIHVQVEVDFRSHGAVRFVIDLTRERLEGTGVKVCGSILYRRAYGRAA